MYCTNCAYRLPENAAFCPSCGRGVNRGVTCPTCAYVLPVGASFCPKCGHRVTPVPASPSAPVDNASATGTSVEGTEAPARTSLGPEGERTLGSSDRAMRDATPTDVGDGGVHGTANVGMTPPRDTPPVSGERVLPSNVGSWAPPNTSSRGAPSPPARSPNAPFPPNVGQYSRTQAGFDYGPPPAGAPLQFAIEPTVGGVYGHAWATVRERFWGLFVVGFVASLIVALIGGAINGVAALIASENDLQFVAIVGQLLAQVFGTWPILAGVQYSNLQTVRSGRAEIDDIFVAYRRGLANLVTAQILATVLIAVGFVFLIVPGIIVALRLSFVTLLVVEEECGPIEAVGESWRRTSGFGWTLLGIGVVAVPVMIAGLLALGLGLIPATMVVALALPTMFAAVTEVHGRRANGY